MAQRVEDVNEVMRKEVPPKVKDKTHKLDKFELLEERLWKAINQMRVLQTQLDRRVFTSKKFMYEDELDKLVLEVDTCTKEIKLLQLQDEKFAQKMKAFVITLLLILLFRFFFIY